MRGKATVNYSKKKISSQGSFLHPYGVIFKIIGPYEYWMELYRQYPKDPTSIKFEAIAPYLTMRTNKDHVEELKKYSIDDPGSFAWQVYRGFVYPAKFVNPLNKSKKRQTEPRGMGKLDFLDMTVDGCWLYAFFLYWKKQPKSSYPIELKSFCDRHQIIFNNKSIASSIVLAALISIYGNDAMISDELNFYRNHLLEDRALLKYVMDTHHGSPLLEPIKTLLQK